MALASCLLPPAARAADEPAGTDQPPTAEALEFFENQIRPLLVDNCYKCHGGGESKGGLQLTSRRALLTGGDSGPAGVPGKPAESRLVAAVDYAGDPQMPPKGKLKDTQIAALRKWAELGFPFSPRSDETASQPAAPFEITSEQRQFWAFQPVRPVAVPAVVRQDWPQGDIDRFVLAGLEAAGLTPAARADRTTLLRRATFDLIGLPPTPAELDAFLADQSPDAFARVIERLLASPQYGERWGRHWLDVVRYADARDTIQLPAESDFREAWRYRDWVVAALNRDLPYDQFLTRQLAGDLLQPASPDEIDADALTATGLLAIADFVPGDVDKEQMIADYVNDEIDVLGRAILGLTLACARCHDHKFDPISTRDYYSLAGIFFSTRLIPGPVKGNTPIVKVPLVAVGEIARREAQAAQNKQRLDKLTVDLAETSNREYQSWIEAAVLHDTAGYLAAAWQLDHPPAESVPTTADIARAAGLDEAALSRWQTYLHTSPHPQLAGFLAEATGEAARVRAEQVVAELKQATARRAAAPQDPISPRWPNMRSCNSAPTMPGSCRMPSTTSPAGPTVPAFPTMPGRSTKCRRLFWPAPSSAAVSGRSPGSTAVSVCRPPARFRPRALYSWCFARARCAWRPASDRLGGRVGRQTWRGPAGECRRIRARRGAPRWCLRRRAGPGHRQR